MDVSLVQQKFDKELEQQMILFQNDDENLISEMDRYLEIYGSN